MAPVLIPIEVIDAIIGENRNDYKFLKSCSVVSKSFAGFCQKHLFSTIELQMSGRPCSLESLLDVITTSPHIPLYVRHLHLRDFNNIQWVPYSGYDAEPKDITAIASLILRKLKKLRTFSITGAFFGDNEDPGPRGDWKNISEVLTRRILVSFMLSSLTTITICDISNFPLARLRQCSKLKNLSLYSIGAEETAEDIVTSKAYEERLPILESLHINDGSVKAVKLLQKLLDLSKLRDLTIGGRGDAVQNAATVIMEGAPHIEVFTWDQSSLADYRMSRSSAQLNMDLDKMPNLRILTFSIDPGDNDRNEHFHWLTEALEALTAKSKMEEVNLDFCLATEPDDFSPGQTLWKDGVQWAPKFDTILTTGGFLQLRRVNLIFGRSVVRSEYQRDPIESEAALRFPLLYKKGMLRLI